MGFEFKILTNVVDDKKRKLVSLLEQSNFFDKIYYFDNRECIDFRKAENVGKIPDTTLSIGKNEIYICQYNSNNVWTNIDELKLFLEKHKLEYEVDEVED